MVSLAFMLSPWTPFLCDCKCMYSTCVAVNKLKPSSPHLSAFYKIEEQTSPKRLLRLKHLKTFEDVLICSRSNMLEHDM
eukprot:3336561-Amphidinium_carterae.1